VNRSTPNRFWLLVLVLALLTGCATQGGLKGGNDATGELGREQQKSPAELYVNLGVAYLRNGQEAVALKKLKKALSLDPNYAPAHNVIALLYERLGETKLAGEHFHKAVRLEPQNPYIHNALGSYLCKQAKYQEAEVEFESALSNPLYPTPWVAMTNAGLCAERAGEMGKAEAYYRRALSAKADYPQALYQMAKLSLAQHQPLHARAYLERYNGVAQESADALWLGVQIEQQMGDRGKANEYRNQLLTKFPDAPEVQLLRQSEE